MGGTRSRLSRLARVRHHPRRTAPATRHAPHSSRPANPTPPTGFGTPRRNRHHTNRFGSHRITSNKERGLHQATFTPQLRRHPRGEQFSQSMNYVFEATVGYLFRRATKRANKRVPGSITLITE